MLFKGRGVTPVDIAPTKTGTSEIPYRIHTTMRNHGRGLPKGLTIITKPSPYESNPDELGSIHVTTAMRWYSWRDVNDTRTTIHTRIISWICLEPPSHQPLCRLRAFRDAKHQLFGLLTFRGARERVRSDAKYWDSWGPARVPRLVVLSATQASTVDMTPRPSAC